MNHKEKAASLFKITLESVNPVKLIPKKVDWNPETSVLTISGRELKVEKDTRIYILGSGKASASMAAALESILGDRIHDGMVISTPDPLHSTQKVTLLKGSHPYPDRKSLEATERLITFIQSIPSGSIVLNLISGGTSALLCKPADGISESDLTGVYKLLVASGAAIDQINTVRKAISDVKGGKLLKHYQHVQLIDLIISDVPNDDTRDIGSGPTIPQEISPEKAMDILNSYKLWDDLPKTVKSHIKNGVEKEKNEGRLRTADIKQHQTYIISSARIVAEETAERFKAEGFRVNLDNSPWSGPIEQLEDHIMSSVSDEIDSATESTAFIFYGECTVDVKGEGKGGRNQELALRIAKRLKGAERELIFLSAGTDGIDGPTDAAGAVVDHQTAEKAIRMGVDPDAYLKNSDSYNFFKKTSGHIITGPTGNNVMDLQFFIIP